MAARRVSGAVGEQQFVQLLSGVVRQDLFEADVQVVANECLQILVGQGFGNVPHKSGLDSAANICGAIQ
jgi:hypothetical protein